MLTFGNPIIRPWLLRVSRDLHQKSDKEFYPLVLKYMQEVFRRESKHEFDSLAQTTVANWVKDKSVDPTKQSVALNLNHIFGDYLRPALKESYYKSVQKDRESSYHFIHLLWLREISFRILKDQGLSPAEITRFMDRHLDGEFKIESVLPLSTIAQ